MKHIIAKGNKDMKKNELKNHEKGFALIIIIIAIAIIGFIAATYYSKRISKTQETKKQMIDQTKQVEKQIEEQMQDIQKKSLESIEGQIVPEKNSNLNQ